MTLEWTPPPKTLVIEPGMVDPWIMDLLEADAAECVQIETPSGFLIRVLPPEQDLGGQPLDLGNLIDAARRQSKDWLLIRADPRPVEFRHHI